MTLRTCPTCGETQHLESYGRSGSALFVHSKTRQLTCKLPTKESSDEQQYDHKEDSKAVV